ncbi:MAG: PQQ-binding-like beta-propeller repeat protein [Clostridiales bacterium]|nr:PQQ-binding-like beta-propeller repeat protein [Clostridiales bacterium]
MSEERKDLPRRRRRSMDRENTPEAAPETPESVTETPESIPETPKDIPAEDAAMSQGPDSRVPPQARRMSASPYGSVSDRAQRRPGTRPAAAVRRPAPETDGKPEHTSRVRVGYAPGRMSEGMTRPVPQADRSRVREYPEYRYPPQNPVPPVGKNPGTGGRKNGSGGKGILIVLIVLLVAALAAGGVMLLPEDNPIRHGFSSLTGGVRDTVRGLLSKQEPEPPRITEFTVTGDTGLTAPADVTFSVTTEKAVQGIRLTDEDGREVPTELTGEVNSEEAVWILTLHVADGFEGTVALQVRREGDKWEDTEYTTEIAVAPRAETTVEPGGEATPEAGAENTPAPEETGTAPEGTPAPEETAGVPGETESPEETAEPEASPEPTPDPTETPEPTPEPTETPEPTATPPLTAEAAPGANPSLITSTVIYNGSKKVKEYSRAAKELIHMPASWSYTKEQIGVLTFRGNAFRQNSAVGTVKGAGSLTKIWDADSGSVRGTNQTYYGVGWTGQPAIVKWSRQVRESSNIEDPFREKQGLKEVIIAGLDGAIRFLDLDTGNITRNSIRLGYPLRGTPCVHPGGYPYMNVGQFARKMKVKTGKIGLRQYNMYTQKELSLIDGLDGKLHRALNDYGSFETSALIDRTSDCVVTAGTNGMLYLINLNSEFDWKAGYYNSKPTTIVMTSKTKNQKAAQTAVESSVAMYDKYVYYADMGGILRCVDTSLLTPVWAVDTGDSVMAAVALDLNGEDGLDLYTANMLNNRKKGSAQIRRFDALSGREIWMTEIGVQKDTKNKTDSGCKASPVIGEKDLDGLVYFTVTGLNDAGRETLGTGADAKAALVALDKETGEIRWSRALSDRSESSPMAVYDADGHGWIIQCAWDGTVIAVDGLTGDVTATLKLEGNIEASPAAYNGIMVIAMTGKGTEKIYGIRIE